MTGAASRGGPSTSAAAPTAFPGAPEGSNSILATNLDPSEQENPNYAYSSMVGQSHNGASGESY